MILYHNVTILTLTEQQAEAMVVEAGRIVKLGEYSQLVREFPQAEQVDLQGATMMPAFLDAHSHYTQVANSFMQISLAGVTTPEELGQRVQKYIQSECRGEHQWIMARDFDDALFGGYPELEWLDSVTLGHPMLISQKSGHMGMLNSEAMKELSIDGNTAQIEGGRIEMKEGKPTGYLEENAFFHYQKQVPMPSMEQFITAFQRAQDLYESYGIHTFQEGMLVKEMIP